MSIGPLSAAPPDAEGLRKSDTAAKIAFVRWVAQRLLRDFDRAEKWTRGWTDEVLGTALVSASLDRCLAALSDLSVWGRENQVLSNEFWCVAGPRLQCGSLQWRARSKPLGYAGDFEMLRMLCGRFVCDHPLGRVFDHYFQKQAAVEAVRSRTDAIAGLLVDHILATDGAPFYAASIGSGPAIDIERAAAMLPASRRSELAIQLFDLDEAALGHARARLAQLLNTSQLSTNRENLYRLPERPDAATLLRPADFILCSGLLDYLPDDAAQRLVRFLWQQLRPDGVLCVGNFAPHNPTRAFMEWIGNWHLIYRNQTDLAALADAAEIPDGCRRIAAETTGLDLFLTARKPR